MSLKGTIPYPFLMTSIFVDGSVPHYRQQMNRENSEINLFTFKTGREVLNLNIVQKQLSTNKRYYKIIKLLALKLYKMFQKSKPIASNKSLQGSNVYAICERKIYFMHVAQQTDYIIKYILKRIPGLGGLCNRSTRGSLVPVTDPARNVTDARHMTHDLYSILIMISLE